MSEFWTDEELENKVLSLVGTNHTDLADAKIACAFKEKSGKSGGKIVPGKLSKFPKKLEPFMGGQKYDYLLEVGYDVWRNYTDRQKLALLDHLLSFGVRNEDEEENVTWGIGSPDAVIFFKNFREFGTWNTDLELLVKVINE